MRRSLYTALILLIWRTLWATPAHAESTGLPANFASWNAYDNTVYMVSTLNLVRVRGGAPLPTVLIEHYGVTRYAVWQDLVTGIYLIQFKQADGDNAGMVANALGWPTPVSHSTLTNALGVPRPAVPVEQHFATHAKVLLGSLDAERAL